MRKLRPTCKQTATVTATIFLVSYTCTYLQPSFSCFFDIQCCLTLYWVVSRKLLIWNWQDGGARFRSRGVRGPYEYGCLLALHTFWQSLTRQDFHFQHNIIAISTGIKPDPGQHAAALKVNTYGLRNVWHWALIGVFPTCTPARQQTNSKIVRHRSWMLWELGSM